MTLLEEAATEYRQERDDDLENLFKIYVAKLVAAQSSCDMTDWFEVGTAWKVYADALAVRCGTEGAPSHA